jgi:hypothetical protein
MFYVEQLKPLPFVCEIHKLNEKKTKNQKQKKRSYHPHPCFKTKNKNTLILRGACITTICLTTQSLQPTDKKLLQKRSPCPD